MVFRSIGLFARIDDQRIIGTVRALRAHLSVRGVTLLPERDLCFNLFADDIDRVVQDVHDELDLGVAIGGDGTMLHLARHFSSTQVPLIGVNLGRLGFLTDVSADRMIEEFDEILNGKFYTERRILIRADVYRDGQCISSGVALNDAVIAKGETE